MLKILRLGLLMVTLLLVVYLLCCGEVVLLEGNALG